MMLALPFVFVTFIINFPAGLILYWITTNVWTIGQQLAIKRWLPPPEPIAATAGAGAAALTGNGDSRPARGKPVEEKPAIEEKKATGRRGKAKAEAASSSNGDDGAKPRPAQEEALRTSFRQWKLLTARHSRSATVERVREVVTRVVDALGLDDGCGYVQESAEEIRATVDGPDEFGRLIGRHGQAIDALQHLAWRAAYHDADERKAVVVDAAGYRARREGAHPAAG